MKADMTNFNIVKRPAGLPAERPEELLYTDDPERVDSIISYLIETGDLVKYKKHLLISSAFACCDTETTTLPALSVYNDKDLPVSFVYLYQFRVGGVNFIFRDDLSFRSFIDRIGGILEGHGVILVVYVHNLSFEWQFFKSILDVDPEGVFALQNRRIGKFTTNSGAIEWRCSYLLSNMSLEKFAENYAPASVRKDKDLIDYEVIRFPWTQLDDEILYYGIMDVISLEASIQTLLNREGDNLKTVPMTNTGYVRRSYKEACIGNQTKHYRSEEEKKEYWKFRNYRRLFVKTQLNYDQYELCCRAFRGGNTHANRFIVGQILPAGPEDG